MEEEEAEAARSAPSKTSHGGSLFEAFAPVISVAAEFSPLSVPRQAVEAEISSVSLPRQEEEVMQTTNTGGVFYSNIEQKPQRAVV